MRMATISVLIIVAFATPLFGQPDTIIKGSAKERQATARANHQAWLESLKNTEQDDSLSLEERREYAKKSITQENLGPQRQAQIDKIVGPRDPAAQIVVDKANKIKEAKTRIWAAVSRTGEITHFTEATILSYDESKDSATFQRTSDGGTITLPLSTLVVPDRKFIKSKEWTNVELLTPEEEAILKIELEKEEKAIRIIKAKEAREEKKKAAKEARKNKGHDD